MKVRFFLTFLIFFLIFRFSLPLSPKEEGFLEKANLLLDMFEYKPAIENYLKFLEKNKNRKNIRKEIAYAYLKLWESTDIPSMLEKALKYAEEEITLFPENEEALDLLFFILYRINDYEKVIKYLDKYNIEREEYPQNPNKGLRFFILGYYFKKNKFFDLAELNFKKALLRGYNPVQCYLQIMDLYLAQRKYKNYRKKLKEAIESCGVQPEFLFIEAIKERKISLKIRYLEQALTLYPNFKEALYNLAVLNYNLENYNKAENYFNKYLKFEPSNEKVKEYLKCFKNSAKLPLSCPDKIELNKDFIEKPTIEFKYTLHNDKKFVLQNINKLALELYGRGKIFQAIKKLQKALQIDSRSKEINYNLGLMLMNMKRFDEAEKYALNALYPYPDAFKQKWNFELALIEGYNFLYAFDLLGNIYFRKGDYNRALLAFKKVTQVDNKDSWGHYNLGCTYFALKNYEKAEEEWKKAIKYDYERKRKPEIKNLRSGLHIDVLVVKESPSLMANVSLGDLYVDLGDYENAIKHYEKALVISPIEAYCYYRLGKIYFKIGKKKEALKYLKKYLEYGKDKEKEVEELIKKIEKRK